MPNDSLNWSLGLWPTTVCTPSTSSYTGKVVLWSYLRWTKSMVEMYLVMTKWNVFSQFTSRRRRSSSRRSM